MLSLQTGGAMPEPREGGVKVVLDVPDGTVEHVLAHLSDAGFAAQRYYRDPVPAPGSGGAPAGWTRLGAEKPWLTFTPAEQDRIVADFEEQRTAHRFECHVIGHEFWTAG